MASPTKILYPEKIVDLQLATSATLDVSPGDLLGYSAGWVKADADAATNIYAQYMALTGGRNGQTIKACKKCLLHDEDAPWTANTAQYLSGTAGDMTETRPTTDGDVIQVVARSLDTTRCLVDIKEPQEFEMFIRPGTYNQLAAGPAIEAHAIDAGIGGWEGPDADSAAVAGVVSGRLPSGFLSLSEASLVFDMQAATALDIDFTLVGAYKGAANNQDTGTAVTAEATVESPADDKLLRVSVIAAFDSDFAKPGRFFAGTVDPDGGDAILIGLYLRGWEL